MTSTEKEHKEAIEREQNSFLRARLDRIFGRKGEAAPLNQLERNVLLDEESNTQGIADQAWIDYRLRLLSHHSLHRKYSVFHCPLRDQALKQYFGDGRVLLAFLLIAFCERKEVNLIRFLNCLEKRAIF